jgi:phosphoribosylamine-glycine ligase
MSKMVVNKPAPQGQSSNEKKTGKKINVLILGKNGICHPLAWKFNQSANVEKIYVQSRNAGTVMLQIPGSQDRVPQDKIRILTGTYETKLDEIPGLAKNNEIDLVVPAHSSYFLSDDLQEKLREGKFSFSNRKS